MANLRIAELDFDQIKTNLKNYLSSQSEFTDYDFEGSGFSVLLDILAYNTHYNAYMANMLANEMFLDSAVKRSSAVSLAKHLNYTPLSARGSVANIDIVVTSPTGLPAYLTLERYTPFVTSINGTPYTFRTNEAKVANRVGNTYTFSNVDITEGTLTTYTYVVADTSTDAKYTIPALNVDTTTLQVAVQTSSSDTTTSIYTLADDITGVAADSKIYYLEQNPMGYYELFFGDGILGTQLSQGNIINITYMNVVGVDTNVSSTITQSFNPTSTIGGSSNISVATNTNSTGGAVPETLTSIKFNASRLNSAKNRAVTKEDYKSLILAKYRNAESVTVWGGEENVPVKYGKVMISLKPFSGYTITQATKDSIIADILTTKKVLAITPEFVDPEYFYIGISAAVEYSSLLTSSTSDEVKTTVNTAIQNYFTTNLQKFEKNYVNSTLISKILDSDPAITSVLVSLKMQKRIVPILNAANVYTADSAIKFKTPIKPSTLTSSYFYIVDSGNTVLVKITDLPNDVPSSDSGTGTLRIINVATDAIINSSAGTVNYLTGEVAITSITPTGLPSDVTDIRLSAGIQENYYNLSVARNEILVQDDSTLNKLGGVTAGTTITTTAVV